MAAYHRVYDSHHLQADCQEPGSAPEPYESSIWATFFRFELQWIILGISNNLPT